MSQHISPDLISEVRARADLVALARQVTELRRSGGRFIGLCPFHDERTPSFHVVPERGFFHCFGCGAHGSAIDFVMEIKRLPFPKAVRALAETAGILMLGSETPPRRVTSGIMHQANSETRGRKQYFERSKAFRIWRDRQPLAGSVAESYLVEARGLGGRWLRDCPALGYAPRLGYWAAVADKPELIWEGPSLLAAMQYGDGKFAAVHVTYLKPDGSGKLELYERPDVLRPARKVRGVPGGAAIRLTPAAERMVVGEGIETTASVLGVVAHGWAAYSLDNLAGAGLKSGPRDPRDRRRRLPSEVPDMGRPGLMPPRECRHVTYLGDGDTKDRFMLEQKLRRAVRRALQLGIKADYAITPPGTDFNDLLRTEVA